MTRTETYTVFIKCRGCGWENTLNAFVKAYFLPAKVGTLSMPLVCHKCNSPYFLDARWDNA